MQNPENWGAPELRSLGVGGVGDPKIHAPPHTCYHVKFGSSASKGVCTNRREPQNWRALGLCPLMVGCVWPHRNTPLLTCVILPNLVVLDQTVPALLTRSARKIWPLAYRLSRSLNVIGTDTDRSITYDFRIFNVPQQSRDYYHTIFETNDHFSREPQIFHTRVNLTPRCMGSLWNWVPTLRSQKN